MLRTTTQLAVVFATALALIPSAWSASSFEASCASAMGQIQNLNGVKVCLCGGLKRPIDPTQPSEVKECRYKSYQPIVDQLNNLNNPGCPSCPQDGYANNLFDGCNADLLGKMLAADKSSTWLNDHVLSHLGVTESTPGSKFLGVFDSASKACGDSPENRPENTISPADLEKYFADGSPYRFGATPKAVDICLSSAKDSEKRHAIGKYYYLNNRIKNADLLSLSAIASIDSILGDDFKQSFAGKSGRSFDQVCGDKTMQARTEACDFYASRCKSAGGLEPMVNQTKGALMARDKLQAELSKLEAEDETDSISPMMRANAVPPSESDLAKLQSVKQQIAELEMANPWMQGKAFRSTIGEFKGGDRYKDTVVAGAIRDQLEQNREDLIHRLDQYRKASQCLNYVSDSAHNCADFSKTIDDTPELRLNADQGLDREGLIAKYYMGQAECRWSISDAQHEINKVEAEGAISAGLTVATLGLSAAVEMVPGVGILLDTANAGKIIDTTVNAGFAVSGAKSAIDTCKEELNDQGSFSTDATASRNSLSCPLNPYETAKNAPNVTAHMQACVTNVVVTAVMNGSPLFAGAGMAGSAVRAVNNAVKDAYTSSAQLNRALEELSRTPNGDEAMKSLKQILAGKGTDQDHENVTNAVRAMTDKDGARLEQEAGKASATALQGEISHARETLKVEADVKDYPSLGKLELSQQEEDQVAGKIAALEKEGMNKKKINRSLEEAENSCGTGAVK